MSESLVTDAYRAQILNLGFVEDAEQIRLAKSFDTLTFALNQRAMARKSSALGWLFAKKYNPKQKIMGLYIYGGVGRGKTMLMDLFYDTVAAKRKQRIHFHDFMQDMHQKINDARKSIKQNRQKPNKQSDPIQIVAEDFATQVRLLCFDEFHVTDITDAMLLGRLFTALFQKGVVVVATSNVAPDDLYKDGLNRALFLPFIELLKDHVSLFKMADGEDFRLNRLRDLEAWHVMKDNHDHEPIDIAWRHLTGDEKTLPYIINVQGRAVEFSNASHGVLRSSFENLCEVPRSVAEYLAIARHFHTVLIEAIPVMQHADRNSLKRFTTLIDALYEHNVKLVVSAKASPDNLYPVSHGQEAFAFARTVSRLFEMQSLDYIARPHGSKDSLASGQITGIVET